MDKLEKRLGKLWRRVKRKGKKSKSADITQTPLDTSQQSETPPDTQLPGTSRPTTGILGAVLTQEERRKREGEQKPPLQKQIELNGSSPGTPRRSRSKQRTKEPQQSPQQKQKEAVYVLPETPRSRPRKELPRIVLQSSDEEDNRLLKKPIIRRRSSKKNEKVIVQVEPIPPNKSLVRIYHVAWLCSFRERFRNSTFPRQERSATQTTTSTSGAEPLKIRIPGEETLSEGTDLGSGYLSDTSYLSSLPQLPRKARGVGYGDREFDESSSGYESGYLSNLELITPRDSRSEHSLASTPWSPGLSRTPKFHPAWGYTQSSLEAVNMQQLSPTPLPRAVTLAKLPIEPRDPADRFLRENVNKTEFVTAVFEAANAGLETLLDDIANELHMWFGKKMLGVACEMQWSVPDKFRNRGAESRMKDSVHRVLRENNKRLLYLKGPVGTLPIHFAQGDTKEHCHSDKENHTFAGVYQRCYRNLLPYCHEETPLWHEPYWNVEKTSRRATPELLLLTAWSAFTPNVTAKRLLRIEITDVDDEKPTFVQGNNVVFVVSEEDTAPGKVVGRLVAEDNDSPPFNKFEYQILPGCNPDMFGKVTIDKDSGEVSLVDVVPSQVPSRIGLCAVATTSDEEDVRTMNLDPLNPSMTRFSIEIQKAREFKSTSSPKLSLEQKVTTTSDSSFSSLRVPIITQSLPKGILFNKKSVTFTPAFGTKNNTVELIDLFVVDEQSGRVRADPQVSQLEQGVYTTKIHAIAEKTGEKIGESAHQFHLVNPDHKLKYVSDMSSNQMKQNWVRFTERFGKSVADIDSSGALSINFDQPTIYPTGVNRSSICFHMTRNDVVLDESTSMSLLSSALQTNTALSGLYHVYQIVNVERCEAQDPSTAPLTPIPHFILLMVCGVAALVLLLSALCIYCCFVQRYKHYLENKEKNMKVDARPYRMPALGTTQQLVLPPPPPMPYY